MGRMVVPGLVVTGASGPQLRGSRCVACGTLSFPAAPYCTNPACRNDRANVVEWRGGSVGTLWSWSIQYVRAPAPYRSDRTGPYAVGMVELPEGLRVLGQLTRSDNLHVGMPVRLSEGILYESETGPVTTWMWEPQT